MPGLFGEKLSILFTTKNPSENIENEETDRINFRSINIGVSDFIYSQLRQRCFSHFHPPKK